MSGFLNLKLQRVHTITRTDTLKPSDAITDSPHVILLLPDTTQLFPQYHLFFTNTFTFYLPSNVVILCLNLYLSFPSDWSTNKPELRDSRTTR